MTDGRAVQSRSSWTSPTDRRTDQRTRHTDEPTHPVMKSSLDSLSLAKKAAADLLSITRPRTSSLLDLRGVSDMTDFFIIASGTSDTHVRSVGEHLDRRDEETRLAGISHRGAGEGTVGAARLRRFRRPRLPSDAAQLLPARATVGRRRIRSDRDAQGSGPAHDAPSWFSPLALRPRRLALLRSPARATSVRTRCSTTGSTGRCSRPSIS